MRTAGKENYHDFDELYLTVLCRVFKGSVHNLILPMVIPTLITEPIVNEGKLVNKNALKCLLAVGPVNVFY